MEKHLAPYGLLFLGSVEMGILKSSALTTYPHPSAFAYQMPAPSSRVYSRSGATPDAVPFGKSREGIRRLDRDSFRASNSREYDFLESSARESSPHDRKKALDRARALADGGRFSEAIAQCRACLDDCPTDAEAYCLLGEIDRVRGQDSDAIAHYQKALYLDPSCVQAIAHLALLYDNRGDRDRAALLRQRIERLQLSRSFLASRN